MKTLKHFFEHTLPLYIPESRANAYKLHVAIWNCGMRPQTLWQAIKDTRITIRKNHKPILVIKTGDV